MQMISATPGEACLRCLLVVLGAVAGGIAWVRLLGAMAAPQTDGGREADGEGRSTARSQLVVQRGRSQLAV